MRLCGYLSSMIVLKENKNIDPMLGSESSTRATKYLLSGVIDVACSHSFIPISTWEALSGPKMFGLLHWGSVYLPLGR